MTYSFTAAGSLALTSCTGTASTEVVLTKWAARDTAWIKHKAQKGLIRSVVIKLVGFGHGVQTGGAYVPVYTDTLNGTWNENELISYADALALKAAHDQKTQVEEAAARRAQCR